jgi:hypothetical protein
MRVDKSCRSYIRASVIKLQHIINSILASPGFTLVNAFKGNNLQRKYACMIYGEAYEKSLFQLKIYHRICIHLIAFELCVYLIHAYIYASNKRRRPSCIPVVTKQLNYKTKFSLFKTSKCIYRTRI